MESVGPDPLIFQRRRQGPQKWDGRLVERGLTLSLSLFLAFSLQCGSLDCCFLTLGAFPLHFFVIK